MKKVLAGCQFQRITDLSPTRVSEYLASRRSAGLSAQSSNHYLRAIKSFTRWMVRERRMPEDILVHLSRQNVQADRRRVRRSLENAEFVSLLRAASSGDRFRELSSSDREMLYLVAAYTGLRASELASLTPESFDLDSKLPTVAVEAACSKHRRKDILPLHPKLADRLRSWIADKVSEHVVAIPLRSDVLDRNRQGRAGQALWPGTWPERAARMLRRDLAAAGIAYVDESGQVFDFHSLRHQFISNLAKSGAHPKVAQQLARHSDINLTMQEYTHLGLVDLTQAIEALPAPPIQPDVKEQATGTGG